MGQNSAIEWTHHTFNPWRGCTKVSPGCAHCYAETLSKRNPSVLGIWGDAGTRVVAAESYWREPWKWNTAARCLETFDCNAGDHADCCPQRPEHRPRVFCASLADVFEDREELDRPRVRLLQVIRATPNLDWLLLTKRPQNVRHLLGRAWNVSPSVPGSPIAELCDEWLSGRPPANVWLGTSVEDQQRADERIPELLKVPAAVRFLSIEPLLGPVNLLAINDDTPEMWDALHGWKPYVGPEGVNTSRIDWVIVGGESGPQARPMHPQWARSIRDQCQAAGVPFFFKQWGEFVPAGQLPQTGINELRSEPDETIIRVGKKAAGRLLDGREWNEFPPRKEATCSA